MVVEWDDEWRYNETERMDINEGIAMVYPVQLVI